ncbi:MAG: hypothetical protein QOH59_2067 [Gemmatimonadales bacterium]|jgi:hypothetical protein|nr:hypothetical protein [Gemmatimonadales bacterium]
MYLVELRPGKEELYRTGDDLALAIRGGDVDARSRIYHRATAKWISITLHPQYKAIVTGQADEPMTRPARKAWGLFPAGLTGPGAEMSSSDAEAAGGSVRHRWKRPIGLGLAGLLLVLGIQLSSSGPRPPWAGKTKAAAVTRHQPAAAVMNSIEGTELISLASSSTVWPATAEPASNTIALPTPVAVMPPVALPRAPRLRTKALRSALQPGALATKSVKANSVEALLRAYEAASDVVSAKLEGGMRVARLNRLFAGGRLSPGGGVTDTRLSLAGAVNFIRVYRQQQAAVEKAYQDSVDQLAKLRRWTAKDVREWYSRPLRKESPTLELVSESLVAGIDSMLGVLDAHAGAYKVRGTAIAFEDPAASQAYGALRRRIKEQIDAAVAAGAATSPGPTSLLLQAIGTSTLPRET